MKIIYAVTSGEYSSYSIDGIYDSKELAELAIGSAKWNDKKSYNEYMIEEFILNPNVLEIQNGLLPFQVSMNKNGNTNYVGIETFVNVKSHIDNIFKTIGGFMIYCYAKNKEHAVKIANEKRIQLIANNEL